MDRTCTILSPVALGPGDARPLAPRVTTLRGRVLGIRQDAAWPSWTRAADVLERMARDVLGVRDVVRFDPGGRIGRPEDESGRVAAFARTVDAAVVGLGT